MLVALFYPTQLASKSPRHNRYDNSSIAVEAGFTFILDLENDVNILWTVNFRGNKTGFLTLSIINYNLSFVVTNSLRNYSLAGVMGKSSYRVMVCVLIVFSDGPIDASSKIMLVGLTPTPYGCLIGFICFSIYADDFIYRICPDTSCFLLVMPFLLVQNVEFITSSPITIVWLFRNPSTIED